MRRGREHAGAGVRWLAVFGGIALAAALGAAAWFLFLGRGGEILAGPGPTFRFALHEVGSVAVEGKAPKNTLRQAAQEIRDTLDAMYLAGFVDPDRWEDGTFPEVLEAFSPATADGASHDLADLTLGPVSARLDSVTPGRSRLDVEFLVTDDGRPFAAVATTTFRAEGKLAGGGALEVRHDGRYVMRPIDGRWVIVGYQVDGEMHPGPVQASPEVSP